MNRFVPLYIYYASTPSATKLQTNICQHHGQTLSVRDVEQSLQGFISHLISTYYCMLICLFCLHFPHEIYIADVNNRHPMKSVSWKSKIISLSSKKQTQLKRWRISAYGPGICTTSHIQLPSNVKLKIFNINPDIDHNKFDAVLKCGGDDIRGSIHCAAVTFDRKQFESVPNESS